MEAVVSSEVPRCPSDDHPLAQIGSGYPSWRCPQCGGRYGGVAAWWRLFYCAQTGEWAVTPDPVTEEPPRKGFGL